MSRRNPGLALRAIYLLVISAGIVVMRPQLVYNMILFDFVNAMAIVFVAIAALFTRRLRVRLLVPISLVFLGSLVAMLNSGSPSANVVALSQEIYLILFFLALYNVLQTPEEIRILVLAWMAAASIESVLILSDITSAVSARALGTFDNPNMAASYIGMSVFLVCHPVMARRWFPKAAYVLLTCSALLATKSLSGLVAMALTALAIFGTATLRARGVRRAKLVIVGIAAGAIVAFVLPGILGVHNYLDRLPGTVSGRLDLWRTGIETFFSNPLGTSIGPGGFVESGFVSGGYWGAGRQLSLHSDYLSFLVERGVIGFMGLMALLGTIGAMLSSALGSAQGKEERLWFLGLWAIFLFTLLDAFAHEVMHYRHVWVAIGLIAAHGAFPGRAGGARGSV